MSEPSLAASLSLRMRTDGGGVTTEEFRQVCENLTPEQLDRIRAKQQWEHCSALAVLKDWPSLFEPETS